MTKQKLLKFIMYVFGTIGMTVYYAVVVYLGYLYWVLEEMTRHNPMLWEIPHLTFGVFAAFAGFTVVLIVMAIGPLVFWREESESSRDRSS